MIGSRLPSIESRHARRHHGPRRLLAVAVALLAGCGEGESEALLVDYQQHLADTLALEAPPRASPDNIGTFPERDQRLFEVAETREGMLDIYALRGCHIASLVAGRNNQLGRVALPSQRWLYELELWRQLSECWNTEVPATLSDTSRERLSRLTELKTEQLPRVSWNALFASEEWVKNFSRASAPLAPEALDEARPRSAALAYLRETTLRQFDPHWNADSATLEGHFKTLQERPFSAELLRTLLLAEQRLGEASTLIEQALARADGQACRVDPERLTDAPEVTRLSEWLATLERSARHWLEAIDALLDAQVAPPPAVAAYRRDWLSLSHPEAPLPAFAEARDRHQTLLSRLRRRCQSTSGT
ncbi:DUF3080 domain-containing protein [Halomonas urmiana]|uniref:DUF3080 domain-containing protein n=1 Tax=Halomonas urmiana TaxID=490901 RepID=A0A5R8MF20_9GAMM|nr:DUF3080 family protein [Halomonas urmiana]TLF48677.1 DUF3080 domain-containing protein [Halomonas urmiana]